jgi:tetratricopeptide (TPR) repeat protein
VLSLNLLFFSAIAFAAEPQFELQGKFSPEAVGSVSLFAVASPFSTSALSDEDGRFRFRKLTAGAYTVSIFVPGRGEARQTIEVGTAQADSRGRVALTLQLKESDFARQPDLRRHSVSAAQLAVPEKARHEYEAAQRDLAHRDVEAAVKHLEAAVSIAPQFSPAWNNLGTIAYQTQQYPRAEECFAKALAADPSAYEPLVNLGGVLINLGKLDDAWKYNVFAVLSRPNDALANAQLGMTYFETGQMELAEKYLKESRRIDPAHFSHPQLMLSEIHLRRGDRRAAADDLEEFLKYHPDWPRADRMRESISEWRQ